MKKSLKQSQEKNWRRNFLTSPKNRGRFPIIKKILLVGMKSEFIPNSSQSIITDRHLWTRIIYNLISSHLVKYSYFSSGKYINLYLPILISICDYSNLEFYDIFNLESLQDGDTKIHFINRLALRYQSQRNLRIEILSSNR